MLDVDECNDFGAYRALATAANLARTVWKDDGATARAPDEPGPDGRGVRGARNPLHVEMIRSQTAAQAERTAYRVQAEASGERLAGGQST